jgi:hypothetical protein
MCHEIMNYKTIHDKMVNYIKSVPSKSRLLKRNTSDPRLNDASLYVELHHIIPRSLGGNDDLSNLIEVLPEEHIFIHMLRYKIYKKMEDMWAVRFMLNGFDSKKSFKKLNYKILNKKIRMGYVWLRIYAQNVRKIKGWQTADGLKRISKAREGKMVAKDAETGKFIGMVEMNHPNVISGKWVHHTKGRVFSEKECVNIRNRTTGQKNPNASGLSEEYFVQKGIEAYNKFGYILSWREMFSLSEKENFKWIKSLKSRFDGKGALGYYVEVEKATDSKYDPYYTRRSSKNLKK